MSCRQACFLISMILLVSPRIVPGFEPPHGHPDDLLSKQRQEAVEFLLRQHETTRVPDVEKRTFQVPTASQHRELYVHGIDSTGAAWEPAVRYRVDETGQPGLIYTPKDLNKIEAKLYLPGQDKPSTFTFIYKDNLSRDQALQSMEPMYQLERRGFTPQIIAPTLPGKGDFRWENNTRVAETWIRTLTSKGTTIDILGNSQAAPIVLSVLTKQENYGRVRDARFIDPAFGSALATQREKLRGIPEIPGLVPGISDGVKDNQPGSEALQRVFRSLPQVDPRTNVAFLNTRSGVVSQEKMIEATRLLHDSGKQVAVIDDPKLLYNMPEQPSGYGPGTNKGFFEFRQAPEITQRGPHGASEYLKYANFETLFKGWTSKPGLEGLTGKSAIAFEGLYPRLTAEAIGLGTGNRFDDLRNSLKENWSNGLKFDHVFKESPGSYGTQRQIDQLNDWRRQIDLQRLYDPYRRGY